MGSSGKQNHTYPLEMGEVKAFGIHSKVETRLTNPYGGLDCRMVELPRTARRPTLSGAKARIAIGSSSATEQAKRKQQSDGRL